jgi:hypothetical protein
VQIASGVIRICTREFIGFRGGQVLDLPCSVRKRHLQ